MKTLTKLITCFLILISFSSFAGEIQKGSRSVSVNSFISEYKVRVIIREIGSFPGPYTNVTRYDIIAYAYADNDPNTPVAIPSPLTVNGHVTWNGGMTTYPVSVNIPISGTGTTTFDLGEPDKLTSSTIMYDSLSSYNLGGIPVSFDQIVFE